MAGKGPDPAVPPGAKKIPLIVQVFDGFGGKLSGADVQVMNLPGSPKKTTGTDGIANFGPVNPKTTFDIRAQKPSFGPPILPFTPGVNKVGKPADPSGKPIPVPLTRHIAQLNVRVKNVATGQPLPGASVTIVGVSGTPPPKTAADGTIPFSFVLAGVPFTIRIQMQGFGPPTTGTAALQLNTPSVGIQPPLLDGSIKTFDASLQPGLRVFLKLLYTDPEGKKRPFPPDLPVIVTSPAADQNLKVAKAGALTFDFERSNGFFSLRFEHPDNYVGSSSSSTKDSRPERYLSSSDLDKAVKDGYRVFRLPHAWSLQQADWPTLTESHFNKTEGRFEGLKPLATTIGSEGSPVELLLDPHWLYVRFEFFDRTFGHSSHAHKRIGLPAMMLDGFRVAPTAAGAATDPDTKSNWAINITDNNKQCQAIPWIIQRKTDKSLDIKPDAHIMLQLVNPASSFVVSKDAGTRTIEVVTDHKRLVPGPDRLKLYDLPALWKSTKYFTRLVGGGDNYFDKITNGQILSCVKPDKFLTFSLDDMVLTDASFNVITLAANEDPAVFFHQFMNPGAAFADKPLSPTGVYNPGAQTSPTAKPYLPYSDITLTDRSYIQLYPNWTRLIAAQGNLFEVFNQRTPDGSNRVVGARAAVRWLNATIAPSFVAPNNTLSPRPSRSDFPATDSFFSIQPMFDQRFDLTRVKARSPGALQEWSSPKTGQTFQVGRFDMVLLRDCDVVSGKEIVVNFHYFRFAFDFTGAGTAVTPGNYRRDAVNNIPTRWNAADSSGARGGDSLGQPTVSKMKPVKSSDQIEGNICWFVQDVPAGLAHYKISVVQINRAFMNAGNGTGSYGPSNSAPASSSDFDGNTFSGWFTAAHECGHGDSLLDEYNERWGLASFYNRSLATWIPGDPYDLTEPEPAIMKSNEQVRPHHLWHSAEWVHGVTGIELQLDTGGSVYKLPHHPWLPPTPGKTSPVGSGGQLRTYVNWPLWAEIGVAGVISGTAGGRRKFDMYLYPLGKEPYSQLIAPGHDLRGVLLVEVKLLVIFDDPNVKFSTIRDTLRDLRASVFTSFNNKFIATAAAVPGAGVDLSPCIVQFTPRFLVQTFPSNISTAAEKANLQNYFNLLGIPSGAPITAPPADPALSTFLVNTAPGHYNTLVTSTLGSQGIHFQINVRPTYTTAWNAAAPGNAMKLKDSATRGPDFVNFFGDMLGLDMTLAAVSPADLKTRIRDRIFRRILTNATVA